MRPNDNVLPLTQGMVASRRVIAKVRVCNIGRDTVWRADDNNYRWGLMRPWAVLPRITGPGAKKTDFVSFLQCSSSSLFFFECNTGSIRGILLKIDRSGKTDNQRQVCMRRFDVEAALASLQIRWIEINYIHMELISFIHTCASAKYMALSGVYTPINSNTLVKENY